MPSEFRRWPHPDSRPTDTARWRTAVRRSPPSECEPERGYHVTCEKAEKGKAEKVVKQVAIKTSKLPQPYTVKYAVDDIPSSRIATQDVWLRVKVHSEGIANQIQAIAEWSYSLDGKKFTKIGNPFTVREGKWIGAKLGFFNTRTAKKNDAAFFDIDWIHFEK